MTAYLLLHGFTGDPTSWDRVVARLPADARVVRPALTGHGDARAASWSAEVDRLLGCLDDHAIDRAHLAGYSMGGRIGWSLLDRAPSRFTAATLIGAHPGGLDDAARRRRREEDEAWARTLESGGIDAFVASWSALPIWASQAALPGAVLDDQARVRRAHHPAGLAHALRVLGLDAMPSIDLAASRVPVRLVVGELDARHRALAEAAARALPDATLHVVPATGHNVILERPETIATLLTKRPRSRHPRPRHPSEPRIRSRRSEAEAPCEG